MGPSARELVSGTGSGRESSCCEVRVFYCGVVREGLEFGGWDVGCGVWGVLGSGVWDFGFGCGVRGLGVRVWRSAFRASRKESHTGVPRSSKSASS